MFTTSAIFNFHLPDQTTVEESVGQGEWISKLSLSLFQQQKSLITYNKIFRVEENLEIIGSKPPVLQMRSLTLLVQGDINYLAPTAGLKPGCFPLSFVFSPGQWYSWEWTP